MEIKPINASRETVTWNKDYLKDLFTIEAANVGSYQT